jgi:tetratricopeptide (TPR) repeat protein
MSRLYLTLLLLIASNFCFGQGQLKKYIEFADLQVSKGDLVYALDYYDKAMELDSNTVSILWKYACAQEAYKNYPKAAYYFKKVYDKENGKLYPESILKYGLMLKQCGEYKEALEIFKFCKKKYKVKTEYNYQKSKQELESTLWAMQHKNDSLSLEFKPLPTTINTKNSEFGHSINQNQFYFSSLQADSITSNEEIISTRYKTKLYASEMKNSSLLQSEVIQQYAYAQLNTGNGSFSLDGARFYFSICKEKAYNYSCKIAVAQIYPDGKIGRVDTLGDIINAVDANTTMPHIGDMNGDEVLFFASNRAKSLGGLDIFYSILTKGQQFSKVVAVKSINSIDNELTPYWDKAMQRLYFSSSWHNGYGGQDVHYATLKNDFFENVVNAGKPINSVANDLYYFKYGDSSYVTSNRIGVLYSKNPTCCSDIFQLNSPVKPTCVDTIPKKETLTELNKRLPVTLYFHNDEPTPKSLDTTTVLSYTESYTAYTAMIDQYKREYSKGLNEEKSSDAQEDIESFFMEYVDYGYTNLQLFTSLLLEELQKGTKINITVKGFASPLAKTDYNVKLTKRRISSMINELGRYQNGMLLPYLNGVAENGGKVTITQIPFGEYKANQLISDNPNDTKNSVYSRGAAIERKIEIISINLITE